MRPHAAASLVALAALLAAHASAAQDCTKPPTAGSSYTWSQGTRVTVYVDPSIPGSQSTDYRNVMRSVFDGWDHVGGSDVSFTIVLDASRAHNPPANSIGIIQDNRSQAGLRPGGANLHSAVIHLDDFSANPQEMRNQLSHEIGHTFGLNDCYSCGSGQSVMGPGGMTAPTQCDRAAVRENGGYFGIDIGDGRGGRPENCQNCGVQNCTVTLLCRCPNGDCRVREGRLVGDWSCTEMGRTCSGGGGCCRGETGAAASAAVCGGWNRASECEWGSVCCFDPAVNAPIEPQSCDAMGWYEYWQASTCQEVSGTTCAPVVLLGFSNWETSPLTRECLEPSVGSVAASSCGAMGGDYCSQNGGCPGGFVALTGSSDCNPCCKAGPSCGAMGGTYCSPTRTCPGEYTAIGRSFDCRMCCTDGAAPPPPPPAPTPTPPPAGPSCGELGGDFCSPTKTCPEGYELLGRSFDCAGCCRYESAPPPPTPTPPPAGPSCGAMGGDYCSPDGSCPAGYDWLGVSYDCSACCRTSAPSPPPAGPSCGAMGGDYCSPDGSCPGGYDWLGVSYDCSACCRTSAPPPPPAGPSCGAMGGDYCSPDGSCPAGYDWLGVSYDCSACCRTSAPPPPPPPPTGPSCGEMGGDYCSQNGSCPDGYEWLGESADCQQCCRMQPDQQP